MRVRLLLVLGMVTLAGCAGMIDGGDADERTLTPAPVPTTAPEADPPTAAERYAGLPRGFSAEGLTDASALARRHVATINDTSYVWTERYVQERAEGSGSAHRRSTQRVVVENETRHRHETTTAEENSHRLRAGPYEYLLEGRVAYRDGYESYADGQEEYRTWLAFEGDERVFEHDGDPTHRSAFDTLARGPVEQYLAPDATTVMMLDGRGTRFELTSSEPAVSLDPPVENYSARAIVQGDGFVRSLTVSYDREIANRTVTVRYRFRYEEMGTATVEPPAWLPAASADGDTDSGS